MLLFATTALASPPLPQLTGNGVAVGVGISGAAGTDVLVDPDCAEDGACEALRHRSGVRGTLLLQVAPFVGGWLAVGSESLKVPAASFSAEGLALEGGMNVNLRPADALGAMVWAEADYAAAGELTEASARRFGVNVGGAARFGNPAEEAAAWLGGEIVVSGNDVTSTLDGTVDVDLVPAVPANLIGGFALWSAGLGGSDSRMFLGGDVAVGAQSRVRLTLGAGF